MFEKFIPPILSGRLPELLSAEAAEVITEDRDPEVLASVDFIANVLGAIVPVLQPEQSPVAESTQPIETAEHLGVEVIDLAAKREHTTETQRTAEADQKAHDIAAANANVALALAQAEAGEAIIWARNQDAA